MKNRGYIEELREMIIDVIKEADEEKVKDFYLFIMAALTDIVRGETDQSSNQ